MSSESLVHHVTTEADFQSKVVQSDKLVLIDFWAEWCPPCRAIAPILEEVSKEEKDVLTIAKVNVDEAPALAEQFSVSSIPLLVFWKNGKVVDQFVGALSKTALLAKVKAALAL